MTRPGGAPLRATLEQLVETARAYARAAASKNTNRAYAADWRDYLRWRVRQGLDLKPLADPECVGLYLVALASGAKGAGGKARTVATIERRLSALVWNFAQRALPFDRKNRHVATVLAGVRRTHGRPPVQKEALLPEHVLAMLDLLPPSSLRNLRDRAILLLGFAGGLRRSEIAGLVMSPEDSLQGSGWPEFFHDGVLFTLRGKTGWREVEIGRGSKDATCPVAALQAWLNFARIARGPIFRAVVGREVGSEPSTTATSHAWSSAWRSPRAFAAICRNVTGRRSFPGIRCGPASPRRPRSTSATSRSTSVTRQRK